MKIVKTGIPKHFKITGLPHQGDLQCLVDARYPEWIQWECERIIKIGKLLKNPLGGADTYSINE